MADPEVQEPATRIGWVVQIYVAAARGAPMEPRRAVTALSDEGLTGDRYAVSSNRKSPDYQLTLIESENIEAYATLVEGAFTPGYASTQSRDQGSCAQ